MSAKENRAPRAHWTWLRHGVQAGVSILFILPLAWVGWGLFGSIVGGEEAATTPANLPFYGSLSSSTIAGIDIVDPFAALQVAVASKTLPLDLLLGALPAIVFYGLIRGRAFCGWACPVNLLLEITDAIRKKLGFEVREMPIPRHAKLAAALGVLILSAIASFPLFEAFSPVSAINKGILFGAVTGIVILLAIVIAEMFWGHRVWCRSLCPLGGFYEALGRIGQVNVTLDREACTRCQACKRACLADPAILEPLLAERDIIVRAGDCMACGSCIDACPTGALSFRIGRR